MESPAKAILILPNASAPAAAAARHGVAASGNSKPRTRKAAPSANPAPSARRGRAPMPIPDPHPARNTIGQPLLPPCGPHTKSWPPSPQPPAGISASHPVAKPGGAGQAVCHLSGSVRITPLSSSSATCNGEPVKAGMTESAAKSSAIRAPTGLVSGVTATAIVIADMVGIGVFTSLGFQVGDITSGFALLLLWVVGGAVALC